MGQEPNVAEGGSEGAAEETGATSAASADSTETSNTSSAESTDSKQSEGKKPESKTFSEEYVKELRGEAAKYRTQAREAEARAKEYEDRDKSEAEKLEERAKGFEGRATEAETDVARLRVALRKGLTETQAKRLIGKTEEELEADADELLASFAKTGDGSSGSESQEGERSETPKGGERSGATGDTDGEETDPRKLAARLPSFS